MLTSRGLILWCVVSFSVIGCKAQQPKRFQAGAYTIDVTPQELPVLVNCYFPERSITEVKDSLHARCLVLDDGATRVALAVVDSCMLPRDLIDEAKRMAEQSTGIAVDHMMISATHTHSAPSVMGCLGSDPDEKYAKFLTAKIVEGIARAAKSLTPAKIGWAVIDDYEHTYCRRWIVRPDKIRADPFGEKTERARMHPMYLNPEVLGPSGPVDPAVSLLSVQSLEGHPIAVFANYSMHYVGTAPVSADYFGQFVKKIGELIGSGESKPGFVGIMSQGTSGDLMWRDYSRPAEDGDIHSIGEGVALTAFDAYEGIEYRDWAQLTMRETKLTLERRTPSPELLAKSKSIVEKLGGEKPTKMPDVYAREQIFLAEDPVRELKLQVLRVGDLGITAIPCEVYGITGLKIKAYSPLQPTFNIGLANGAEGYIPPPEQHKLGGYTTWPARSAGLEFEAEPKIVETLVGMLESVSGKPRRTASTMDGSMGDYPNEVLKAGPIAYWRMNELTGPRAADATKHDHHAAYESGVAFYLPGANADVTADSTVNRSPHFAGGRMKASVKELGSRYTVEMHFFNCLPSDARAVTGYLFSRWIDDSPDDQLALGGTKSRQRGILFMNDGLVLEGETEIQTNTWYHLACVRDGEKVTVFLNGKPEIVGTTKTGATGKDLFVGGAGDGAPAFEGKIDEVAVYTRALSAEEVGRHFSASVER